MIDVDPDIVSTLQDEVGDALRSVAVYDENGYEFEFIRDDVEGTYTIEEIEKVYDDLVIQGLSREFLEQLFHAGQLQCSMYGFEEATMFHFTGGDYSGLFVSIDRTRGLDLDAFISACKGAIEAPA